MGAKKKKNIKSSNSKSMINTDMDIKDSNVVETKESVPKWKKNSDQLRNAMKGSKGTVQDIQVADDRLQCPCCSRKFAEESYSRH